MNRFWWCATISSATSTTTTTTTTASKSVPRWRMWAMATGGIIVVIVIITTAIILGVSNVAGTAASSNNNNTSNDNHNNINQNQTTERTSRLDMFRTLLLDQSISSAADLDNITSPQYQALDWLANKDLANLTSGVIVTNSNNNNNNNINATSSSIEQNNNIIVNRYIMATFYFATNGPKWFHQLNFLSSKNICYWYSDQPPLFLGVSCHDPLFENSTSWSGKPSPGLTIIKDIDLRENNLVGTIPSEMGRLLPLQGLDLSSNFLKGILPTELGMLSTLEWLDLGDNRGLSGTIPTEFGKVTKLEYLNLYNNVMSGTVPTVLATLPQLDNLQLQFNNFTGNLTRYFCENDRSSFSFWISFRADCNSKLTCDCCSTCY